MVNEVVLKNVMCIQWTVQTHLTESKTNYVSEDFLCQNSKCHLEFSVGRAHFSTFESSHLYYRNSNKRHSSKEVVVRVSRDSGSTFSYTQATTIPSANESIWSSSHGFQNSLLTFEISIHIDTPRGDKSVQVSPYTDACFSLESLSHDFSKLLLDGPDHDVEFTVGDQTIKAHKIILCARSKVFASMLKSDMVEGKTGRVKIEDIDAAVFKQFLKCLYTGMLPELTVESAFQFYEAFDKYGVEGLKKQCADFLTVNLTHENACDILALSDRHSDEDFKKTVIEYAVKEKIPYIGEKWDDFCTENPKPAVEVYRLFCEQFRSK